MCKHCGCNIPVRDWPNYGGTKVCPNCDSEYIEHNTKRQYKDKKPNRRLKESRIEENY